MREVSMYAVQYRVTGHKGTGSAGLMYANEQQGIEMISKSKLPWVKRFKASYGQHVTLQAQILSSGFLGVFGGEVTVEILVNGSPWRRSTAKGFASIATASGTLGVE